MSLALLVKDIENRQLKEGLPQFRVGDDVTINVCFRGLDKSSKSKKRTQAYSGTIVAKRGAGLNTTITVRRVSRGVGVERIFPIHSPELESIVIV
jgi:large subunit ribosomal protein L19